MINSITVIMRISTVPTLVLSLSCIFLQAEEVTGVSGIVRVGDSLAIVSDRSGYVYKVPIPRDWPVDNPTPFRGAMTFRSAERVQYQGDFAVDLESLEALPDGSFVVLSEAAAALLSNGKVVAVYLQLRGLGARGVEGLSISPEGRAAVLWEGGWLNQGSLPTVVPGVGKVGEEPLNPIVCIHKYPPDSLIVCPNGKSAFALNVPAVPEPGHAFRATDLIWSHSGDELIVLLGSGNKADDTWKYRWLQRFSLTGEAIGPPLNLCDRGLLPEELHQINRNNLEGLAWFDSENVVLVNDTNLETTAVAIDITPWPTTNETVACN